MSLLHTLISIKETSQKRVGRGYGSGKGGHTSGRGQKGQKSRGSNKVALWFEGGQLPIIKRMPMIRGKSKFKALEPTAEVNLSDLEKVEADVVTLDTLKLEKIIDQKFKKAKIISGGKLTKKLTIKGLRTSKTALEAIQKSGGSVE